MFHFSSPKPRNSRGYQEYFDFLGESRRRLHGATRVYYQLEYQQGARCLATDSTTICTTAVLTQLSNSLMVVSDILLGCYRLKLEKENLTYKVATAIYEQRYEQIKRGFCFSVRSIYEPPKYMLNF